MARWLPTVTLLLVMALCNAMLTEASYFEMKNPNSYHPQDFNLNFSVAQGFYGIPGPDGSTFLAGSSPVLGMSMGIEYLAPCAQIAIHTHPRGNELVFVASGGPITAYLWFENNTLLETQVPAGTGTAAPIGLAHAQLNDHCKPAVVYVIFDSAIFGTVTFASTLEQVPGELERTSWEKALPKYRGFMAQSKACLKRCKN